MTELGKQPQFIRYTAVVPYESWMDEAELYRLETVIACARKSRPAETGFGQKVITLPKPPSIPPVKYVTPAPDPKQRDMEGSAFLDFRKGSHVIDPAFSRNPQELMRIMDMVYKASKDPDVTVHHLSITGYASPEGSIASNEKLSRNRAASLKEYVKTASGLPENIFRVTSVGEDWGMLRKLVENSDINQKQAVLDIIDNSSDYDRKESQLKALGAVYHLLLSDFFPQLRRVEYHINYTVRDYSITEAQKLLGSDPEKLSSHELYLLAGLYEEGSAEWNDIILKTVTLYPDDPAANINAAAVYINTGAYDQAKKCLDKVKEHPDAQHNLSVYQEMMRQGLL